MKRGTKLYLVDTEGNSAGPFGWTLVRQWFALSLLAPDAWVFVVGEEAWRGISEFSDLCSWPQRTDANGIYYRTPEHNPQPSTPVQRAYLQRLGFPLPTDSLDFYLASHIISQLAAAFPERVDLATQNQITQQLEEFTDWRNEPASDRQIQFIASLGGPVAPNLTKGEASELIDHLKDPPSEGQLRRLRFYRIALPRYLSKDAASRLIDAYVTAHPESEEDYQTWKLQQLSA